MAWIRVLLVVVTLALRGAAVVGRRAGGRFAGWAEVAEQWAEVLELASIALG